MNFFSERAVMGNAGLTDLPGKINLPAFMPAEELHKALFNIPKKRARREDRVDILSQSLDRFFKRVNAVFEVIFLFRKSVRSFGRTNKLMHEQKIVGATVSLFLGSEKLQAFF